MKLTRFLAATGATLMLGIASVGAFAPPPLLHVNGVPLGNQAMATLYHDTTYVSLRNVSQSLDEGAAITWSDGTAMVQTGAKTLRARPGDTHVTIDDQTVSVPQGVKLDQGRTLLPVRVLAQLFGATVCWDPTSNAVSLSSKQAPSSPTYSAEDLYWLSRIISAESRGEPMEGKIAVGNVVLNRVANDQFPNSIYEVIFDARWGGQFEPVRNGTIYHEPTAESVEAAKRCLEGANVVGGCLYFFAPSLAQNFWIAENRKFVTTIGCQDFYL